MNTIEAPTATTHDVPALFNKGDASGKELARPMVRQVEPLSERGEPVGVDNEDGGGIEHTSGPYARAFSFDLRGNALNPIIDASAALLSLGMRFGSMRESIDLDRLHTRLLHEIESIELELHRLGYDRVTILAHRYCLCAFIDEAIMTSPSGLESSWSERSLLALFHNETWGGEKFFTILERMLMEPNRYLHLLEFLYTCLSLGYSGRHKTSFKGRNEIEAMLKETHDVIRKTRGAPENLSFLQGANIFEKAHHVAWRTPVTMVLGIAFVAAIAIYAGFFWFLDRHVDQTLIELSKILGG